MTWGASCRTGDSDFGIYEGSLDAMGVHAPITCSTSGGLTWSHDPPGGSTYYLVVPTNLTFEGSYGTTSAGVERTRALMGCRPQAIGTCP